MATLNRWFISLGVASAVFACALIVFANLSECVYLTIPAVALSLYLTNLPDLRQTWRSRVRATSTLAVGAVAVLGCLAFLLFDSHIVLTWRFWLEAGSYLYFLAAAFIVVLAVRRALLAFARSLYDAWQFSPGVRTVVCEVVPMILLLFVALPYAMAFSHVHRFKMPNGSEPTAFHGRAYENVEFVSSDGTVLRGWWIPANKPSSRTLVFCHGVAANRSIFLAFVEVGDWLDANVLMFDLRGHGESDGRTVTLGYREKDDVLAAIAYVRRERPEQARTVIGMGVSLGAASMAEAAARVEPPLDGVILDSSFTSTREMTANVLRAIPNSAHPWLMTLGLPMVEWHAGCPMMSVCPEQSIGNLRAPVLFLHSKGDPLIPSEHSCRLYERATGDKHLCIFDLDGHCNGFFAKNDRYRSEVSAFSVRVSLKMT